MSLQLKDRILSAVPIESYIGRYVRLKASGQNSLQGLCPFHKEKTPSFTVSPAKGLFFCFGCSKGGNLFNFVMERERVSFPQALEILARHAGISLEKLSDGRGKKSSEKNSALLDLNAKVMQTFRDFLQSPQAKPHREYLKKRGLSEKSIQFFNIGASPERWEWLGEIYPQHKKELLELGLLRQKEGSRPPYDFFRNRIIFPIFSLSKMPLAFGGRSLPGRGQDREAKYINSTDSPLFKKSRLLYGLSENLDELRSRQEALLVEGYLDVIGLWQVGLRHSCAPLGTSLSSEHLRSLSSYVKSVTFLFDGDEAGLRAAQRAAALSLKESNLKTWVCVLPPGSDPFDLCRSGSATQLNILLEHRVRASDFFLLESLLPLKFQSFLENEFGDKERAPEKRQNISDFARTLEEYYTGKMPSLLPQAMEKRDALNRLYEELRDFPRDTDRSLLLEGAARIFKLDPLELQREWKRLYPKRSYSPLYAGSPLAEETLPFSQRGGGGSEKASSPSQGEKETSQGIQQGPIEPLKKLSPCEQKLLLCERRLILELFFHPELCSHFNEELAKLSFQDPHSEFFWRHLESRYFLGNMWDKNKLTDLELPEESRNTFSSLIAKRQFEEDRKRRSDPKADLDEGEEEAEALSGEKKRQESLTLMEDYVLKHGILEHEKKIDELSSYIPVAEASQKGLLVAEKGELIQALNHLKTQWRYKLEQSAKQ